METLLLWDFTPLSRETAWVHGVKQPSTQAGPHSPCEEIMMKAIPEKTTEHVLQKRTDICSGIDKWTSP